MPITLVKKSKRLTPAQAAALPYDVLDVYEAAALLRVHPVSSRKHAKDWGVPWKRIDNRLRFGKQELLAWLRSYESTTETEGK
jgi:hypothetical protein